MGAGELERRNLLPEREVLDDEAAPSAHQCGREGADKECFDERDGRASIEGIVSPVVEERLRRNRRHGVGIRWPRPVRPPGHVFERPHDLGHRPPMRPSHVGVRRSGPPHV